mgnify:CR=1 FL=1|jgi:hypothetical protein|tara:strand:+ start:132 stop:512 length:381 start_codon:yes stop_codon:yes gene_type:complete
MKKDCNKSLAIKILLCLSVALCGAFIQFNSDSSIALSRAGAVIVCIGILYGFIELKVIFAKLEGKRQENDIVFSDRELKQGVRGSTDQLKTKTEADRQSLGNIAAITDMLILVAGTLLWGFGDLLI